MDAYPVEGSLKARQAEDFSWLSKQCLKLTLRIFENSIPVIKKFLFRKKKNFLHQKLLSGQIREGFAHTISKEINY